MDETLNSFTLRGRQYWLDANAMQALNYCIAYDTTLELACKALNLNFDLIDNDVPEYALYEESVRNKDSFTPDQEMRYIKSKIWMVIEGQNRTGDILKAMQMLIELTLSENTDSLGGIKALREASADDLTNMLKELK